MGWGQTLPRMERGEALRAVPELAHWPESVPEEG